MVATIRSAIDLLVVFSFTDIFLGGQFWSYGWRTYDHYMENTRPLNKNGARILPMCSLFPTVTS